MKRGQLQRSNSNAGGKPANRKDARGAVRLHVSLRGTHRRHHTAGNITKTMTIKDARVSEVFAALERAFPEEG